MLTAVENHQNEPLGRSQSLSRTQTQRGSRGCRSGGDLGHVDDGEVTTDDNDEQFDVDKKGPDRS